MRNNILYIDEVSSTNDAAKKLAIEGAKDGTVIVAESQTGGRGRRGRIWQSANGDGLYFSMILRHRAEAVKCQSFTLVAAVAVKDALNGCCGVGAAIKWPNDIILNEKKLCGILTETNMTGGMPDFMILGVGVNVNNPGFDGELIHKATSLFLETGAFVNKKELLEQIIGNLDEAYGQFKNAGFAGFLDIYKKDCLNIGQTVSAYNGKKEICGKAVDITELGELVIQTDDNIRLCINSGEVTLSPIIA